MTKRERSDKLRRRPDIVRYFYLVASEGSLHSGMSWGGLNYVRKRHQIIAIFLADLTKKRVVKVTEDVDTFMDLWRAHYNDPTWEYQPRGGEPDGDSVGDQSRGV